MPTQRRAVIDIGTNSVKLLVAEAEGIYVRPVFEESHQTRLGQGFYETRYLEPARIAETARSVAEFAGKAHNLDALSIRVIATSAAREALNGNDLSTAVLKTSGLPMEIISGQKEAALGFIGISTDESLTDQPLLLIEVGGGSTQFTIGQRCRPEVLASFPIGAVRLNQQFAPADPPGTTHLQICRTWLANFVQTEVAPKLKSAFQPTAALQLVGTGGTATILGCMEGCLDHFDRAALEGLRIAIGRVRWHVEQLWSLPLAERRQIVGLPKNRADIILFGSLIYEAVMTHLQLPSLRISTRGLRFGAVLESASSVRTSRST